MSLYHIAHLLIEAAAIRETRGSKLDAVKRYFQDNDTSFELVGSVDDAWLVHFTNSPSEIASGGFRHGSPLEFLGEPNIPGGGAGRYNFAFKSGSEGDRDNYGKHAVMFRADGVEVYNSEHDESYVIFWGPDVPPHRILALLDGDDGWRVEDGAGQVLFGGPEIWHGYEDVTEWVKEHN